MSGAHKDDLQTVTIDFLIYPSTTCLILLKTIDQPWLANLHCLYHAYCTILWPDNQISAMHQTRSYIIHSHFV